MGKPGNAPLIHLTMGEQTAHELYNSPKTDNYQGWYSHDLDKKTEKDNGVDPGPGKEEDVGAQYPRYCPAGSDHRDRGIRGRQCVGIGGKDAAEEIKQKEPQVAQHVFDVIAEYPEVEHVATDMKEPAVHEHRGEDGQERGNGLVRMEGEYVMRDRPVRRNKPLRLSPVKDLKNKYRYVQGDDEQRDEGNCPRRVVVFIRDHFPLFLSGVGPFTSDAIIVRAGRPELNTQAVFENSRLIARGPGQVIPEYRQDGRGIEGEAVEIGLEFPGVQ